MSGYICLRRVSTASRRSRGDFDIQYSRVTLVILHIDDPNDLFHYLLLLQPQDVLHVVQPRLLTDNPLGCADGATRKHVTGHGSV